MTQPAFFIRMFFGLLLLCSMLSRCQDTPRDSEERVIAAQITQRWYRLMLDLERYTPGYRPPVSARSFAYIGLTAYTAALPALPELVPANTFLPDCPTIDFPDKSNYYLPAALNAAYAKILQHTFATAPKQLLERIPQTEKEISALFSRKNDDSVIHPSIAFGKSVAEAIWQWSETDSLGHDACMYNYDRNFVPEKCAGCWQPPRHASQPALLPHWGEVRTFILKPEEIPVKPPIAFDDKPGSAFYSEAMEVFTHSQHLSRENQWIAEFWSDDLPEFTVSPSGRWISITWQAIEKAKPDFITIIEVYLKTGIALHDAGVLCWKGKYYYQLERPDSYIQRNIQSDWQPLHPTPNFPAYPSGHAACGAAAATVLSETFGSSFKITDRTHEGRTEFQGTPRTFHSFQDMAHENALSRLSLGVHFRMDCEEGLRIGRLSGHKINAISLHRETVLKQ
jgi:hypothetical protein